MFQPLRAFAANREWSVVRLLWRLHRDSYRSISNPQPARELVTFGPPDRGGGDEFGIVPLGMPLIAGPALLTALLILIDTVGLVFTLLSLLVNLALVAVALCNADRFSRWMGTQGLRGVSKIIALLLAAIAVSLIRRGWHGV